MNNKDWVCPICLDSKEENCYILEPCKHKFHTKCLIESLRKCGTKCPYCRGLDPANKINEDSDTGVIDFDNVILPPGLIRVNRYNTGWVEESLTMGDDLSDQDSMSIGDINILEEILSDELLEIDHSLDISNDKN